jgi:hypothetical protein
LVVAGDLAVWLYGTQVALVSLDRRNRSALVYTDDAFERYPLGTPSSHWPCRSLGNGTRTE